MRQGQGAALQRAPAPRQRPPRPHPRCPPPPPRSPCRAARGRPRRRCWGRPPRRPHHPRAAAPSPLRCAPRAAPLLRPWRRPWQPAPPACAAHASPPPCQPRLRMEPKGKDVRTITAHRRLLCTAESLPQRTMRPPPCQACSLDAPAELTSHSVRILTCFARALCWRRALFLPVITVSLSVCIRLLVLFRPCMPKSRS